MTATIVPPATTTQAAPARRTAHPILIIRLVCVRLNMPPLDCTGMTAGRIQLDQLRSVSER